MAAGSKIHGDYRIQLVHTRFTDGRFVFARFTVSKGAEVDAKDAEGRDVKAWSGVSVRSVDVEAQIACKAVEFPSGGKAVELTAKELGGELKQGDDAALYEAIKAHLDREDFAAKMTAEAIK